MSSSFFSIIIPTYNRPVLLKRAVDSVLNQTYSDFEIIIVNDGSSVDYSSLLSEIKDNERILYFNKPNGGLADARNFGIKKAQGSFICFLDDDDEYLGNHLEVLNELIHENNLKTGLYRTLTYIRQGEEIQKQKYNHVPDHLSSVERIYSNMVVPCNVCIASEILKVFNFNSKVPISEDYEMWSRILLKYPLFLSQEYTTIYHLHEGSCSMGESEMVHLKQIKAFKQIFSIPELKKELPTKLWAGILYNRYLWLSEEQRKKKKLIKAGISRFKSIYFKIRINFTK